MRVSLLFAAAIRIWYRAEVYGSDPFGVQWFRVRLAQNGIKQRAFLEAIDRPARARFSVCYACEKVSSAEFRATLSDFQIVLETPQYWELMRY